MASAIAIFEALDSYGRYGKRQYEGTSALNATDVQTMGTLVQALTGCAILPNAKIQGNLLPTTAQVPSATSNSSKKCIFEAIVAKNGVNYPAKIVTPMVKAAFLNGSNVNMAATEVTDWFDMYISGKIRLLEGGTLVSVTKGWVQ